MGVKEVVGEDVLVSIQDEATEAGSPHVQLVAAGVHEAPAAQRDRQQSAGGLQVEQKRRNQEQCRDHAGADHVGEAAAALPIEDEDETAEGKSLGTSGA